MNLVRDLFACKACWGLSGQKKGPADDLLSLNPSSKSMTGY